MLDTKVLGKEVHCGFVASNEKLSFHIMPAFKSIGIIVEWNALVLNNP